MKKRITIPKAVSDSVLKEYHHRCAICGRHDPQLHHIDENPSNNEPPNLIPLCPNCHLQDIHAPTAPIDQQKVLLFRRCKDPFILDPRFHPVWTRLRFLRESDEKREFSWKYSCHDLTTFVSSLRMGDYYATRITAVLKQPVSHMVAHLRYQGEDVTGDVIRADKSRHQECYNFRATAIEDLCVEMLRYQEWTSMKSNVD